MVRLICSMHSVFPIDDVGHDYYLDYIPDKRVKSANGRFGSGTLVGAFCTSAGSTQADKACTSVFKTSGVAAIGERTGAGQPSIQSALF